MQKQWLKSFYDDTQIKSITLLYINETKDFLGLNQGNQLGVEHKRKSFDSEANLILGINKKTMKNECNLS